MTSEGKNNIESDVSADNFKYYLGSEYDNLDIKILERYKNINGMEGNSPISSNNNFSSQKRRNPSFKSDTKFPNKNSFSKRGNTLMYSV